MLVAAEGIYRKTSSALTFFIDVGTYRQASSSVAAIEKFTVILCQSSFLACGLFLSVMVWKFSIFHGVLMMTRPSAMRLFNRAFCKPKSAAPVKQSSGSPLTQEIPL